MRNSDEFATSEATALKWSTRVMVGDVYAIRLADGRFGYVHYIVQNDRRGPLLRVFDLITDEIASLEEVRERPDMFSPILGNFYGEVKSGRWIKIGRIKPGEIEWPLMVGGHHDEKNKCIHTWFLVYSDHDERIGPYLSERYRGLQYGIIWTAEDVAERIRTGEFPDSWWLRPCYPTLKSVPEHRRKEIIPDT